MLETVDNKKLCW